MNTKSILPRKPCLITPESILRAVCDIWSITPQNLLGSTRKQPDAFGRQVCMVLVMEYAGLSKTETAMLFRRDYTTVLWAEKTVIQKAKENKDVMRLIKNVVDQIQTII